MASVIIPGRAASKGRKPAEPILNAHGRFADALVLGATATKKGMYDIAKATFMYDQNVGGANRSRVRMDPMIGVMRQVLPNQGPQWETGPLPAMGSSTFALWVTPFGGFTEEVIIYHKLFGRAMYIQSQLAGDPMKLSNWAWDAVINTSGLLVVGKTSLIVMVFDRLNLVVNMYIDGIFVASSVVATNGFSAISDSLVRGGNINDGFHMGYFFTWSRPFSATDAWALWDPATRWDMYLVSSNKVFYDLGATAPTVRSSAYILG